MCMVQQPKQPEIVYQGPSEEQIKQQKQAMDTWTQSIQASNASFQANLQDQIDANNKAFNDLTDDYNKLVAEAGTSANKAVADANAAAGRQVAGARGAASGVTAGAASDAVAQQIGALTVTTSETEPEMAQTTESAAKVKKNKKKDLKINTAGIKSAAGSGVNLGI